MSDNYIIGCILFYISSLGVISNWTVLLFLSKISSVHKSFGCLTRNQAFGDAIQSTTVFLIVVPMILLDIKFLKENSNIVSFIMLFGYEVSVLSHLLLSCNRLCAVISIFKYYRLYSQRLTMFMILFVNFYALISILIFYISGCKYYWNSELHMFMYHASNSCVNISFYAIFVKYLVIILVILVIDLYSIHRARLLYRKSLSESMNNHFNKKEISLLVQTCLQGLLFSIELVCYFILSPRVENKWTRFFCTTFAFSLIHACDGKAIMSDSVIVGSILFFVSLSGVFTNWTVLIFLPKVSSFNKSFGYITWNQAFGDALQSTTVFTLVVPMVFFDLDFLKLSSNYISLSMLLGYDISVLSHLLLAINRLCVVASPLKFQLYSEKLTLGMIIAVNIYAFASIVIFLLSGCKYSWSSEMWMFLYHVSNQCVSFSFYAIFCKYITIIFIIVLIDIFVIIKARLMYQKSRHDASSRQMNSKEIAFLIQTCLQGVLFSIELICYFIISPTIEHTWVRFFMTTFAFSTIHACDGAISIACNSDFRYFLYKSTIRKIRRETESVIYSTSRVEKSQIGSRSRVESARI